MSSSTAIKPTHLRMKTKEKVFVERFEGGTIVVKRRNGKAIGSYTHETMQLFNKRYKSLVANNANDVGERAKEKKRKNKKKKRV